MFRDLVIAYQPRGLERDAVAVYWHALGARFPLGVLRESADRVRASHKFFPSVAEWTTVAARVHSDQIIQERYELSAEACEWCGDQGLVRIQYEADAFDVAICSCWRASFYRTAGPEAVRYLLQLDASHRVALIEEFDETEDEPPLEAPGAARGRAFVYALQIGDQLKIGFTTNPARRRAALCSERSRDGSFIGCARVPNVNVARMLERRLQHQYGAARLDREWFRADARVVAALRDLLRDPVAVDQAITEAQADRQLVAPREAQQYIRVMSAVAKDIVKAAPAHVPPETLAAKLVARCLELKIPCDESAAERALRAAAYMLQRGLGENGSR